MELTNYPFSQKRGRVARPAGPLFGGERVAENATLENAPNGSSFSSFTLRLLPKGGEKAQSGRSIIVSIFERLRRAEAGSPRLVGIGGKSAAVRPWQVRLLG